MPLFTSGRDYRPHSFPSQLPPEATYVRVLVRARDAREATYVLDAVGLSRYAQRVRQTASSDKPAHAVVAYMHLVDVEQNPVFVIYQARRGSDGVAYQAPRFYATHLVGGELRMLGRIRVVSMSNPLDPEPVAAIVDDDAGDDEVPMPTNYEGPDPDVGLVEGVLPYPPGRLGGLAARLDRDLTGDIADVRDRLTWVVDDIVRCRISEDPRAAYLRGSNALLALTAELASLAAQAQTVEVILQNGTD